MHVPDLSLMEYNTVIIRTHDVAYRIESNHFCVTATENGADVQVGPNVE